LLIEVEVFFLERFLFLVARWFCFSSGSYSLSVHELFVSARSHNEPLPVAARRVSNPDGFPFKIHG